ncbi:MAG: CrcB family protein [Aquificaceae bacterium]|nr:CrcB family protein [Aquificaceae bacterium]MDW8237248.1 CrcB family protein [Aquificaceae bacterium]
MSQILAVAIGGAIGALARFFIVKLVFRPEFPLGTMVVNLTSAFLIGVLFGIFGESMNSFQRSLFVSGLLGGYSTFSSLVYECFSMILEGRLLIAIGYILASNILGLVLVAFGYYLGKAL